MKGSHSRWANSLKGEGPNTSDLKISILESMDVGSYLPKMPDEFFDDLCQSYDYSVTELTNAAAEEFEEYRRRTCKEIEDIVSKKQSELMTRMKQIHDDTNLKIQAIRRENAPAKVKEDEPVQQNDATFFQKRAMNDTSTMTRPQGALGASLARTTIGEHFPVPVPATAESTGLETVLSPEKRSPVKREKQPKADHKVKFAPEEDSDIELDDEEMQEDVFNIDEDLDKLNETAQPSMNLSWAEEAGEDRNVKDESVGLLHSGIAASFSAIPTTLKSHAEMQNTTHFGDSHLQGPYDTQTSDTASRFMSARRDNRLPKTERHEADEDLALAGVAMANAPSHRHLLARSSSIRLAEARKSQQSQGIVDSFKLAQSVPYNGAVQIQRAHLNSDAREGLEREPKTSLPYNEKLIVPSLLKATRGRQEPKDVTTGTASAALQTAAPSSIRKTGFRISSSSHVSPSLASTIASNTQPNSSMSDLPPLPDVPSQHIRLEPSTTLFPRAVPGTGHMIQDEDSKMVSKLLHFTHYLQNLKLSKRTGWYHHNVPFPESISDHMYRMAVLSILIESDEIDFRKCATMALVHDMAEALVGDLTPLCKVEKEEKRRREVQAIHFLTHDLLGDTQASRRIYDLWHEYEDRQTPEAKLVKDLDCFELCLQAYEYERTHNITDLQPFWDGAAPKVTSPEVQRWMGALLNKREAMWTSRGMAYRTQP